MTTRTQATRLDVIEAQDKARKDRRDTLVLAPVAAAAMCLFAYALAGFLTPAM